MTRPDAATLHPDLTSPMRRPLRIAWIGPAGEGVSGVPGMGTQLLESVLDAGHRVDLFTQEETTTLAERVTRFPNLTTHHFPAQWSWNRWYSRHRFTAFVTSALARSRAYRLGAAELICRHRQAPFDCIFQVSQTELFNLGSHRDELPPIIVYPCVHAAGELRWHRRESRYARQSEPIALHYGVRAFLKARTWLQKRELRKAAVIIGMSRHFNDLIAGDYGVPANKMAVLYHPIRAATGEPGPGSGADAPVRLLYVARISVRKGLQYIVELSQRLNDLAGRVVIEVIGGPSLWSNYMAHLGELNPSVAKYLGELPHDKVDEALSNSDGLLLPSRYEPGGLVVGEALARGTPVVVSDVIGSAEPVSADCCRRFPDGDMDEFERCVRELVQETVAGRTTLRAAAAAEAKRHFRPEKIGADLIRILESAVATRKADPRPSQIRS